MASTVSTGRLRPADALRRIADSLFRRRTVRTASGEFGQLTSNGYSARLVDEPREGRELLRARVAELLAAGALDEAHGDVFDRMIDALVVQWRNRVDEEHDDNQRILRTHEAEAAAEVGARRLRLAFLQAQLAESDADLARLLERHASGAEGSLGTPTEPAL